MHASCFWMISCEQKEVSWACGAVERQKRSFRVCELSAAVRGDFFFRKSMHFFSQNSELFGYKSFQVATYPLSPLHSFPPKNFPSTTRVANHPLMHKGAHSCMMFEFLSQWALAAQRHDSHMHELHLRCVNASLLRASTSADCSWRSSSCHMRHLSDAGGSLDAALSLSLAECLTFSGWKREIFE